MQCLEVEREEEFAPVKVSGEKEINKLKEGVVEVSSITADTPEHAQLLLSRLHAKWIAAAAAAPQPAAAAGEAAAAAAAAATPLPGRHPDSPHHVFCEVSPLVSYEGEGIDKSCFIDRDLNEPLLLLAPNEEQYTNPKP